MRALKMLYGTGDLICKFKELVPTPISRGAVLAFDYGHHSSRPAPFFAEGIKQVRAARGAERRDMDCGRAQSRCLELAPRHRDQIEVDARSVFRAAPGRPRRKGL